MKPDLHARSFWFVTAAAVVVATVTLLLGQWQLRRAAQKEASQAAVMAQSKLSTLDNASFYSLKNNLSAVYRPAQLRGVWQVEHTVFLDNRPMVGKTGFFVVTPLALEGSSQVVLVQRGWVPRDYTSRTRLPDISTPQGTVTVRGHIAPPPSKLYEFKGVESGRIRQNIDVPLFAAEISTPLLLVSLVQTGAADEGLLREWAAPNLGVERHYGYAFQWFALCALVIGLYVWFQLIHPLRLKSRATS